MEHLNSEIRNVWRIDAEGKFSRCLEYNFVRIYKAGYQIIIWRKF